MFIIKESTIKEIKEICPDITDDQIDKLIWLISNQADKYANQVISSEIEHAIYSLEKYGR